MNKLLAANFSRMFKDKMFWIGTIFMAAVGIVLPLDHYRIMIKEDFPMDIDGGFFIGAVFIGIILSVFCSLFVGTEYSDGTIRNKIVVGQKRTVIYFSNLITCIAAGFLMCTAYFLSYLCVGLPLLGTFQTPIETVILFVLCTLILSVAFSSIFTLIAMSSQSKAISAVICILSAFFLLFAGGYIQARLNEPEIYDKYTYVDETGEIVTEEPEPNTNYVDGIKREVYKFLADFLPGGQSLQITNHSAENPGLLMLYSGVIIIGTTGAGLWLFRKKDLK